MKSTSSLRSNFICRTLSGTCLSVEYTVDIPKHEPEESLLSLLPHLVVLKETTMSSKVGSAVQVLDNHDEAENLPEKKVVQKDVDDDTIRNESHANEGDSADFDVLRDKIAALAEEEESSHRLERLEEEENPSQLEVGDHVYQWRSWMAIPRVFQHHGIVMDIIQEGDATKLIIADFSNVERDKRNKKNDAPSAPRRRGLAQEGIYQTYSDTDKWYKVRYETPWLKQQVSRAGTCTGIKSDAIGLVLARVNFIIRSPEVLPDYHVVNANCECVAFWCKTGKWSTLQASSFLELTAAGQVKSSATLATTAATTKVAVPASGIWGWFGYTSQVSFLSLHPMVLPALAGYAAVTVGVPAALYVKAKGFWKETAERLNNAFWESAMEQPDVFAECMTHWSDKRSPRCTPQKT